MGTPPSSNADTTVEAAKKRSSTAEYARVPKLRRMTDVTETVQLAAATLILVFFVTVMSADMGSRFIRNSSIVWANESARLAFLWSSFLAAAPMFRRYEHLAIDMLRFSEGSSPARVHSAFVMLCNVLVAIILAWLGFELLMAPSSRNLPLLGWPMKVGWLCIPAMGVTMMLYLADTALNGRPGPRRTFGDANSKQTSSAIQSAASADGESR